MKTKRIPFDINKAQAGAKVITRDGRLVKELDCFDCEGNSHPIIAYVQEENGLTTYGFTKNGTFNIHEEIKSPHDLFIEEEEKTRLMTHQELADWLRKCPEECREFKYKGNSAVIAYHDYYENEANTPVHDVLIRRSHGEWMEPQMEV